MRIMHSFPCIMHGGIHGGQPTVLDCQHDDEIVTCDLFITGGAFALSFGPDLV